MKNLITYFSCILAVAFVSFYLFSCDDTKHNADMQVPVVAAALPPCDSLENVVWGDTLRVVNRTITSGIVRRGAFAGKKYWQAMLYSNNLIEPTRFQNSSISHRVVIADTTEITYSSVFIVARIKN